MSNEERDIIDKETEKIISICTQFICELKMEYGTKALTKQQRIHINAVLELLANYLKAVYNIFNDQKNYRISRDIESYKFLKLNADRKTMSIEIKDDFDLYDNKDDEEEEERKQQHNEEETGNNENVLRRRKNKGKKDADSSVSTHHQSLEDDRQQESALNELNSEDLQMLEIENKQLMTVFKGLTEEVQQIERHVYDIAKLQEIFTEKVSIQKNEIERISNTVIGTTENVKEANEQIREATQRNAGLRVYILFFLLVMSFSLLFLDWYND